MKLVLFGEGREKVKPIESCLDPLPPPPPPDNAPTQPTPPKE